LPGDVDRQEEHCEDGKAPQRVVHDELVRELGDGDDEDDVEEALYPTGVALAVLVERLEPRRAERRPVRALLTR
jgi:hypothetical protein